MHSRSYIEETITNRLQRKREGDREVSDMEFRQVMKDLEGVVYWAIEEVNIDSFTEEDLMGFMVMKAHQMMRRDEVDFSHKSYKSKFYRSFKNLMYDIIRMQSSAHRRGLYSDPIDTHTFNFSYFVQSEEGDEFIWTTNVPGIEFN